jgi:O-antigen ligase
MMPLTGHITAFQRNALLGLGAITVFSALGAFVTDTTFLLGVPLLLLLVVYTVIDYKHVFYLLLFLLPCSIEYYFPNGLATDLPTEPLMFGMTLVTIGLVILYRHQISYVFVTHPLMIMLIVHILWMLIAAINSEQPVYSYKIFAAKLWYYIPFAVLPTILLRGAADIRRIFWSIFIPLTILIIVSVMRHGVLYGFGFQEVNKSVTPYFRNHVNYAAMMSVFFPMLLWARTWYPSGTILRRLIHAAIGLYVIAIFLSYTRTAMLALIVMIPFYIIVTRGWTIYVMSVATVVIGIGLGWLFYDNHYLKFAPDYETTIYHDDFGSHIESTFDGKDVSAMERVYRWVAAVKMSEHRPWMGVGSGNFSNYYKKYTVTDFETYISDNEERSTAHNYFLLILAEQGWIGLIIFFALTLTVFFTGHRAYTKATSSPDKIAVVILMLIMISVYINLILSDMLESDKVGPFFFLFISILAMIDRGTLSMSSDQ